MIRHLWSILCLRSSVDRSTNNISLFEVIEQIAIPTPQEGHNPGQFTIQFPCQLVTVFTREPIHDPILGHYRISYLSPEGRVLFENEGPINLQNSIRHRQTANIPGLPVTNEGMYTFQIEYRTAEEAEWNAHVLPLELRFT